MPSASDTAYPRLKLNPSTKELNELYSPTVYELAFARERAANPCSGPTAEKMEQCRWVKPKLICQVAFVEWTDAGHLRHRTFVAMRDDKKPPEAGGET